MKIKKVLASPGLTGFFFDDQAAIRSGAKADGFTYLGEPLTPGFKSVRQAGESISVMIITENGDVAYGDCAAVQYSGAGGRDPLFIGEDFLPLVREDIARALEGETLTGFRTLAEKIDNLKIYGRRLHTAIRYGVTQAILDAVAKSRKMTMTQVISEEYSTTPVHYVPIFCQTGDERHINADKALIKRARVLPHGLINHVADKLGLHGELLLDYARWLKDRAALLGEEDYCPVFHFDVYGTIGLAFEGDIGKVAAYIGRLEEVCRPHRLRVEGPIDAGSREGQIEVLKKLREKTEAMGVSVEIVADEWCNTLEDIKLFTDEQAGHMVQIKTPDLGGINNTIEAVLYCKSRGMGAYLGGTCNETDRSAQVCVHIALATGPDQMLAKPGMGMDEGLCIVTNEMRRTVELLKSVDSKEGIW